MRGWTLITLRPMRRDQIPHPFSLWGTCGALILMLVLLIGWVSTAAAEWAAGIQHGLSACAVAGAACADSGKAPGMGVELSASPLITVTFQQGVSPNAEYAGVADTYISANAETTNYGQDLVLRMSFNGRDRILLRFDLADYIPPQAAVTGARLELYAYYSEYVSVPTDVGVYEVLRPWAETEATWTRATAEQGWQQVGCEGPDDRSQELTAMATFRTVPEWQVWDGAELTGLVQRWVSNPAHNHGVILVGMSPLERQSWILYSSQMNESGLVRPRLTVSYYIPTPTPTAAPSPTLTSTPAPSATPMPTETPTPTRTAAAAVSGAAWQDENRNHQRDPDELPMSGVTVTLLDSAYVELGRRVTVGDGSYEFANLGHGDYVLTKEDPPGFRSTWPLSGLYAFYLAGGQRLSGLDFGFALLEAETPTTVPTPSPTPTLTSTGMPTATLTRTPTPTATITPTPLVTGTVTEQPAISPTPTHSPSATPTRTSTLAPTLTQTVTPTPSATPSGSFQDPIRIVCQETYSGTTADHASVISNYGACGTGMWGPEVVYTFQSGYALNWLGIALDTTADLALFMLSDANPATCFSSGGSVVVPNVAAGVTYYIVVDGFESGSYVMEVFCHPPPATTPTATPMWTATPTAGPSPTPTRTRTPGGPLRIYLPILHKPRFEFLVDCGSASDHLDTATNDLWLADRVYSAGGWGYVGYANAWSTKQDIVVSSPTIMRLYQTVRYGYAFAYQFDVPNGNYTVELHFAEIFHDRAGRRVFDVIVEGQTVLNDLDVFVAAGGQLRSIVRSFATTVTDGQLDVVFESVVDLAMVNAIRVRRQ